MGEVNKETSQILPLLPLRDIVIFPNMVVPFFVGRTTSLNALNAAIENKTLLFLCSQKDPTLENPEAKDLFRYGTLVEILRIVNLPDGTIKVFAEGKSRAFIEDYTQESPYLEVMARISNETISSHTELIALQRSMLNEFETYVKLNKNIGPETLISVQKLQDAGTFVDAVVVHLNLKLHEKQELIEHFDVNQRAVALLRILKREVEILRIERKIKSRVKEQMDKGQKEYYLNEQMAAIQKELGTQDEFKEEINEFERKIQSLDMSEEAREKAQGELRKLKMMAPMSAEATVVRVYLNWVLSLPWGFKTKDNLNLTHAKTVLDQDHYGLKKIKERVLEYIAIQSLTREAQGSILCFVGPPGVGKTSLASTIARAVEKRFVRISLGGVRDESEIRGHRRTYVGAQPGKIVQALKKVASMNPIILLDEIDKMGTDQRGDPASAMLEVLDPSQNKCFGDHYLEIDFDLTRVMFIATANSVSSIPQPLLDRMELIPVSSYTEKEKIEIASRHLVPKILKKHGMANKGLEINDDVIAEVVRYYTREAGVRSLERELSKVARKAAKEYVLNQETTKETPVVDMKKIEQYLGPRMYKYGGLDKEHRIGVCTGLAWTEVGGDILSIEVSILPGKGKIQLTGKLGDVMQESAQAAYSYVRSCAKALNLPVGFYEKIDIHVHVPEGATPKDGPSAGITMVTALASALTGRAIRKDVAMTGEVTLRGSVLEIGGLKEKVIAAHRAGIKLILVPEENRKDLEEIPAEVLKHVEIKPVEHVNEVLLNALIFNDNDPLKTELEENEFEMNMASMEVVNLRH